MEGFGERLDHTGGDQHAAKSHDACNEKDNSQVDGLPAKFQ
jgi:hypothetical protein